MKLFKKIAQTIVSICTHISPKLGCQVIYFMKFKKFPNLSNPKEFNEKLMWLKLNNYNYNENVWKCADKYEMREYCINKGIDKTNFPKLIGVYENVNEINFAKLPEKFALKCTHGMGFNIICDDKSTFDIKKSKKQLEKWQNTKFGYESAEPHYTHIAPKIICEEFIENEKGEFPLDYKIYCFNGKPELVLVCFDRKKHYTTAFYDINWKRIHLRDNESKKNIEKPMCFDEMLNIAKKVSKEFPFVRVDFYEHNNKAILGELTFTPAACLGKYTKKTSVELGNKIKKEVKYEKN